MKRIVVIVSAAIVFILLLSFSAIAAETAGKEEYIVEKGDSLWKISRLAGVNWLEIARVNKIKKPFIIYPEQKLVIPPWIWENHGADAYGRKNPIDAINSFKRLPEKIKRRFIDRIEKGKWKWSHLSFGDKRKEMVCGHASGVMGSHSGVIVGGKAARREATRQYVVLWQGVKYVLDDPLICHNWTWGIEKKPILSKFLVAPVFKAPSEFPSVPIFRESKKEEILVLNEFDLYMGGGTYESVHYDAHGYYFWGKARYRPFEFSIKDDLDLRLGIFAFGGLGAGNDEGYGYHWKKWVVGPTAKLIGNHWDADFDAGIGKLCNKGGADLYKSKQIDDIFLLSAHGNFYSRRDKKEKWFPKTELNLEATLPYSEEHRHSWDEQSLKPDASDNRAVELFLTQWVYDFDLNKHLRLTPGFNLGIGRNYGLEQNFYQLGPCSVLSWRNEDIFSVSFLNYKEMLGGDGDQWHWLSGWLNVGGIIRAYKAAQITEVTNEDLGKLTKN